MNCRMMGLPSINEWPEESPVPREAFLDCTTPVISLERLIRFQDSCAFKLLRVRFDCSSLSLS